MRKTALLFVLLSGAVGMGTAWACSCRGNIPVEEKFEGSSAVFVGKVLTENFRDGQYFYEFNPTEIFKGLPRKSVVVVSTPGNSAACGCTFFQGGEYLIYAGVRNGELSTNLCAGNVDLDRTPRTQEVEDVRALQAKKSAPNAPGRKGI